MARSKAKQRPVRAVSGLHRKMVTELRKYIRNVTKADQRAIARASALGVTAITFMNFNNVPSPTQFLYDRSNAQISQATAARESAKSRASMIRDSPNAYWNHVRDFSSGSTYDVSSRRSLASRATADVPPLRSPTATAPAAPARVVLPLASFFQGDGPLDWPKDAPDDGAIGSDRREAEAAITAVRDQTKAGGKAHAQSVGLARSKLIGYGQQALARSREERAPAMADVFHYFLLILNDALGEAAG